MKGPLVLLCLVHAAFAIGGSYLPSGGALTGNFLAVRGGYYGPGSHYQENYHFGPGGYGQGRYGGGHHGGYYGSEGFSLGQGGFGVGGHEGFGGAGYYPGQGGFQYAGQFQHTRFGPGSAASNRFQVTQSGFDGYGPSSGSGEISYFPKISYDAKSYEHGSSDELPAAADNQVHFYGSPSAGHTRLRIRLGAAPQKTRVLYVKSPDASSSIIPEIVAPNSVAEDKTTVYVLSKKQEPHGSITIPSGLAGGHTVQSKPEVYYLKYDNAHDAERAVAESLSGYGGGQGVVAQDKSSFVKSLVENTHASVSGFSRGYGQGGTSTGYGGHGYSSTKIANIVSGGSKYGTPGASGPY